MRLDLDELLNMSLRKLKLCLNFMGIISRAGNDRSDFLDRQRDTNEYQLETVGFLCVTCQLVSADFGTV
ncbi:hypothetical protein JOB18_004353 [Solea senegalensis]|uniref:Uncharacterized protein n=1 Tax=Solea senegalensis TaxID=28829 RepID=A0AAV6SY72_SOLSE|nr:hypothetical protein JOB18_004353 [Solea senegalensis]